MNLLTSTAKRFVSQPSLCRTAPECYEEGTTRYNQGHYTEALRFYEASQKKSDTITSSLERACIQTALWYNFGRAYEGDGQPEQARKFFGRYIEGIDQLWAKVEDLHQRSQEYRSESQKRKINPIKVRELKSLSRHYRTEFKRYKQKLARLSKDYEAVKFGIQNSFLEDWADGARWRAAGNNQNALQEYIEALASPHKTT